MSYYNWNKILASKSIDELKMIILKEYHLGLSVRCKALEEIKSRQINTTDLELLRTTLINELKNQYNEASKTPIYDIFLKNSLYFSIIGAIALLIRFLFSYTSDIGPNYFWLFGFLYLAVFAILDKFITRYRLKKRNLKRANYRNEISEILESLKTI